MAALAVAFAATAATVRTATENFVTNKIAEAVAAIPSPDYSTNNTELVETIQTKAPTPDLSPFLRKDLGQSGFQEFGGFIAGMGFNVTHETSNFNGWNNYTAKNGPTQPFQSLPDYIRSNPWDFQKRGEAIPTTGGVFNVSTMHFAPRLSVGPWNASIRPYDISGGSGAAFVFGDNLQTKKSNTMTLGVGVLNTNEWSFIWSGDANRYYMPTVPSMSNPYSTRYNGGFHVNPSVRSGMVNPLQNFWIGDTNLNDWIVTLSPPTDTSGLLPKSGGTMSGELYMAGSVITFGPRAGLLGGHYVTFSTDGIETGASGTPNPLTFTYPNTSGRLALTNDIPVLAEWAKAATKPTYTASEVGATTPADVTAAIREQSLGGIWDEALQVWWTPRMRNGSLTYEATTNVNLNAEN